MDRRRFLHGSTRAAAALLAAPGAVRAAILQEPRRTPFPYVDGLTFPSPQPDDIRQSGLSAFLWDVSAATRTQTADGSVRFARTFEACTNSIREARSRLEAGSLSGAFLATRGSDIVQAHRDGRTAVFFQFQGADPIGSELGRLDQFHQQGLRVLQITHHHNNEWGGGAIERSWTGLTKIGFEGIERLNELNIIPDLSHVSDPTSLDVLRTSRKPVIVSHGGARALVNNARCTSDEVIRRVADSGGAMGVFMMSCWLTADVEPTTESYIRQVRHIAQVGGIDAVAIANDYTVAGELNAAALKNDNAAAVQGYYPWWDSITKLGVLGFEERLRHVVIPELNNVQRMFRIHEALDRAGYSTGDVEKIMGGNWVRVLRTLG